MHFQGCKFKNFLGEHASRSPLGLMPFGPSFTWPLAMYLHVLGEIMTVTPASKLNDSPVTLSLKIGSKGPDFKRHLCWMSKLGHASY